MRRIRTFFNTYLFSFRGVITSKNAIVVIQLRLRCGFISKYWEFSVDQKKTFFLIPMYEVRRAAMLLIEDENGNLLKKKLNHFKFSQQR